MLRGVKLIFICETKLYLCLNCNVKSLYVSGTGIQNAIATSILSDTDFSDVFVDVKDHMYDNSPSDNHLFSLVKSIATTYCKVRLFHLGKERSQEITGKKIRKKLGKLIHFKNQ